eukprot:6021074-Pleurochrysis_carterae.AAC.1
MMLRPSLLSFCPTYSSLNTLTSIVCSGRSSAQKAYTPAQDMRKYTRINSETLGPPPYFEPSAVACRAATPQTFVKGQPLESRALLSAVAPRLPGSCACRVLPGVRWHRDSMQRMHACRLVERSSDNVLPVGSHAHRAHVTAVALELSQAQCRANLKRNIHGEQQRRERWKPNIGEGKGARESRIENGCKSNGSKTLKQDGGGAENAKETNKSGKADRGGANKGGCSKRLRSTWRDRSILEINDRAAGKTVDREKTKIFLPKGSKASADCRPAPQRDLRRARNKSRNQAHVSLNRGWGCTRTTDLHKEKRQPDAPAMKVGGKKRNPYEKQGSIG